MTRFRPCIDLHNNQVKQIIGGTLTANSADLETNFISPHPASHFARLYRDAGLVGGHVIMLGPGSEEAAKAALSAWPSGLQLGGGINEQNAADWLSFGAEKASPPAPASASQHNKQGADICISLPQVILTSYLFPAGSFSMDRLQAVLAAVGGDKEKVVLDLSCRRRGGSWFVAMDKWQTVTDMEITLATIQLLEPFCSEFLVHAADHEGLQAGIDEALVRQLSRWCSIPVTYAGGAKGVADLSRVRELSKGAVDLTIGSALDIFGGSGATLQECCDWNNSDENLPNPLKRMWED
ncbi:MAG: Enzyme that catalyzes the fourth step in the histidine pathway [Trizodia sp. TS-e1964]|nr:MAG: Enzyme that catalyzes the fourth step in the histidine pathway [Trizodia sp. TS-e1964]